MPGRRALLSSLVVVALLLATAAGSYLAYESERDDAMDADLELSERVAAEARADVMNVASGLRGAAAIVNEDGGIDPVRFRAFARDVIERSPFLGLSWAPKVDDEDRAAFEEELGRPITRLDPDGGGVTSLPSSNDTYLPLAITYPSTAGRRQFLGLDTLSDPTRAAAARAAIKASEPQLSTPLTIAQTGETGTGVYAPVTLSVNGTPRTVGVMISGVPGDAIADQVRRRLGVEGKIAISDDGEALTGELHSEDDVSTKTEVLGRRWLVSVPASTSVDLVPAISYGVAGLTLTLLAAGLLAFAARRERSMAQRQADAELRAARESLLTRITEAIEREIEVKGRLRSLARTLVPAVGDVCSVHEVTAEGAVRRVGVAALDEETEAMVRALPEPTETSPIRAAVSSREPVLYTRIAENREAARARERGIEEAESATEVSAAARFQAEQRSNMIVPLVARGRVLGTISLSILNSSGRDPLDRDDIAFGMEVATHAAMALDNARLYEQQRDIAAILQQALLPRSLPEVEGAAVAVRHRPGRTGTEVGGDFYDLFEAGDRWVAVVGDVCGKGPEAAALTALVRHTLRATARLGPEEAVLRVHEAIQASGENTYCTLACAELRQVDDGLVARVTTAGHPEPRVVRPEGTIERLDVTGPLVGVLHDPVFEAQEVRLPAGSTFFMCSDGVPEARRNGEIFGDLRLERLLAKLGPLDPEEMLRRLEAEVVDFVEGRPRDDLALFALRVNDS